MIKPQMEIWGLERERERERERESEREVELEISLSLSLEAEIEVLLLAAPRQETLAVVVCPSIPIIPTNINDIKYKLGVLGL